MDTGTFYLYEYENNVRKRNAGFLKIYRRYQSCIFQAHIRSISLENVSEARFPSLGECQTPEKKRV